jgi:hypothetical protein
MYITLFRGGFSRNGCTRGSVSILGVRHVQSNGSDRVKYLVQVKEGPVYKRKSFEAEAFVVACCFQTVFDGCDVGFIHIQAKNRKTMGDSRSGVLEQVDASMNQHWTYSSEALVRRIIVRPNSRVFGPDPYFHPHFFCSNECERTRLRFVIVHLREFEIERKAGGVGA